MKLVKSWGLPLLSIFLVCLFPCGFLYFQNAGEAHFVDVLPVLGVYLAVAAVAFLVLLLLLRNPGRAAVLADLGMLVIINFEMISGGVQRLFSGIPAVAIAAFLGVLLLGLLVVLLWKKPDMTVACGLIALAFGAMLVINGILSIPTIISVVTYEGTTEPITIETTQAPMSIAEEASEASAFQEAAVLPEPAKRPEEQIFEKKKRNVYFFLFDEFGGPENLQHYFEDDNGAFFSALEERGFSVSNTSKNPESPWTVTLIPNIMNLEYVTNDDVEIKNRLEWLEDPALYRLFRNNGYQLELINHEGFLGETGCRVITRGRREENIGDMIFENGALSRLPGVEEHIRQDVLKQGSDEYTSLMEVSDALRECGNAPKDGPTLTVGYFIMPHAPFAADERGNPTPEETYYEWRENEHYWGMLRYTSDLILEAVDNIQRNDPEAVILLLADHGARKPGHIYNQYGGPEFDAAVESPFMMNVLCSVYDPENKVTVEGDTCINATRKTLDQAFGLHLGTLEPPPDYELSADDIIGDMGRGH